MKTLETKESEFGRGLTYCLGLFLAHAERDYGIKDPKLNEWFPELFFNAASDHLYELDTSRVKNKELRDRIEKFRDRCIHLGHGFPEKKATADDVEWSIREAKTLLAEIDYQELGVDVARGNE